MLLVHGIGTRDRAQYEAQVLALGAALGEDRVRLIPAYWGDVGGPPADLDPIVPYAAGAAPDPAALVDLAAEDEATAGPLRAALLRRDLDGLVDAMSRSWRRRSAASRVRLMASVVGLARTRYQRASEQVTGDLVRYQRHQADLHARIWETVMALAPGWGIRGRPIDVITHSLGGSIVFDMAVGGRPRLHVGTLLSCASQISYFHAIGCSPTEIDPAGEGRPVTLPPTIGHWRNFYVPLDPWAFLAAPMFTLADGSPPLDVEVYGAEGSDRIITHALGHYLSHPRFLDAAREALGLAPPSPAADDDTE